MKNCARRQFTKLTDQIVFGFYQNIDATSMLHQCLVCKILIKNMFIENKCESGELVKAKFQ